ncbi:hypothetical protein GYB22_00800 [bacterium]|nr:hypothetical protein [bacterium]
MNFQEQFVQYLKDHVPNHVSIADEIAELLSVSKDSAYRRLRNDTPFTLDEAVNVCEHFKIDTADLFRTSGSSINFKYNKLYDEKDSFLSYMKQLLPVIQGVHAKGGKIIYAAEDVPLFHHFAFERLASFKIFYWSKAVLNSDQYLGQKFEDNLIHPDIRDIVKKLHQAYNEVESVEIWTEESINSTLRQILYFAESGQFNSKEQAHEVLEDFHQMTKGLQVKAEKSSKLPESSISNFTMYNSEVLIGNNCIMLDINGNKNVFISHNTFNSMRTSDEGFCEETENWIQNLIRKSTLISDVSEKHRFQFFKKMYDSIQHTAEQIDKLEF